MSEFKVNVRFKPLKNVTETSSIVMRTYGITIDRLEKQCAIHSCQMEVEDGDVVYFTGPSGAGKSVLLNGLYDQIPEGDKIRVSDIGLEDDKRVVDCFEDTADIENGGIMETLRFLGTAGLNDCKCFLNTPARLSDGQKWRYRLAKALATRKKWIFADEFCSGLDLITAMVISSHIRKFADQYSVRFALAGCRDELTGELRPETMVIKDFGQNARVVTKEMRFASG